jgi:serine/threonine protein kinase
MATVHVGRLRGPAGFARTVAIKRLHAPYARDPEFVSMFLDEARLAARIRHPNVVSVLDVVAAEGELFLVMDYIHGESLSHLIKVAGKLRIPMPRRVVVTIMVGVLSGLDAAHEARNERGVPLEIVHRDVSPQNVVLGLEGVPMVLDFGVAKASLRVHWSTQSGLIKGKLGYMAPEQLATGFVDKRADIYAAGVMLWEGLTGKRLFDPNTIPDAGAIATRIMTGEIQPPSTVIASTPKALDEIVMKALARSPDARFPTAREMAMALEKAISVVPNRQVGDWVAQVAGDTLQARAHEVNDIEGVELPPAVPSRSDFPAAHLQLRTEDSDSGVRAGHPPPRPRLSSGLDLAAPQPAPPGEDVDVDSFRAEAVAAIEAPASTATREPPIVSTEPAPVVPGPVVPAPVVAAPVPPVAPRVAPRAGPTPTRLPPPPRLSKPPVPPSRVAAPPGPKPDVPPPSPQLEAPPPLALKVEGPVLAGQLPVADAPVEPVAGAGVPTMLGRPVPEWTAALPHAPEDQLVLLSSAESRTATTIPPAVPAETPPSLPPEAGDGALPLAPRGLVWGAGVACVALLVLTLFAVRARMTSAPQAVATSPTSLAPGLASAPLAPSDTAITPASVPPPPEPLDLPASPASPAIPTATAAPQAPPTLPRRPKPAKTNCNPPFTTDSQGVRVPKRECFR